MPKRARELTALDVKRLDHPGGRGNVTVAVGGVAGLMLQITPGGGRSWLLRTMVGAKRREIGLGSYPTVTLAQARERGREALDKIRKGVDPVVERAAARAALAAAQRRGLSFSVAVDRFIDAKLDEFRNDKHKKQWRSTLRGVRRPARSGADRGHDARHGFAVARADRARARLGDGGRASDRRKPGTMEG
jgi:hypothetical protein